MRVSVAMELPFVKEGEGDEEVHFFGIIRNLSAGGIFMETREALKEMILFISVTALTRWIES